MNARTVFAWLGLTAVVVHPLACTEPVIECQVGLAGSYGFATTFTPVGDLPACATAAGFSVPKGDTIGMEFYDPSTADTASSDSNHRKVALQAASLGTRVLTAVSADATDPNPAHVPYALGVFASRTPDAKGFCSIVDVAPAEEDLPAIPARNEAPGAPATSIRYEFSNVKVYVTADAPGTQFSAALHLVVDGCAMDFQAVGMWPAISCQAVDGSGNPVVDGQGKAVLDPTACDPCADLSSGRVLGSGINPNFPTRCDPDLALCVLSGDGNIPQIAIPAKSCE